VPRQKVDAQASATTSSVFVIKKRLSDKFGEAVRKSYDLLDGTTIEYPRLLDATFKQAPKSKGKVAENQDDLPF